MGRDSTNKDREAYEVWCHEGRTRASRRSGRKQVSNGSKFDKDKEERGERAGREEVGQEGKKSGRPQFGKDNGRVASGVAERVGCGAIGLGSYFVLTRPRRVALSDNSLL